MTALVRVQNTFSISGNDGYGLVQSAQNLISRCLDQHGSSEQALVLKVCMHVINNYNNIRRFIKTIILFLSVRQ